MNISTHLLNLTSYNVWAQERIAQIIAEAGEEAGIKQQFSSFPTIRETLIHIWDAQAIWLDRINQVKITGWPGKTFKGNTQDAARLLVENCKAWLNYTQGLDNSQFDEVVDYVNLSGERHSETKAGIIAHVMNHSTYHRGQIITMLRGAGYTGMGSTDLITFLRLK